MDELTPCECEVCVFGREVMRHIDNLPVEERRYFERLYEQLVMTELDRDVNAAIISGEWPGSDEIIASRRKMQAGSL